MKTSMLFASSIVLLAACGGGKKDPPLMVIDGPPQQMDAPAVTCTAPATFDAPASYVANVYSSDTQDMVTGNQEGWRVIGPVNSDALPDLIWIELFEGAPPAYTTANFPATPFTIQLTGAETDYFTCSMCISMTTDEDAANMAYADDFMATGGSVTITTLTSTMIAGTLNGVSFKQVEFDFDAGTQTDAATSCTSMSNASVAFSTAVAEPPPAFGPNGRRGFAIRGNFRGTQRQ